MAARNIPRRKAQTALVIAGLMMATVTISSAFTTGDSVTASIEQVATEDLRNLDQLVTVHDDDLDALVPVAEDIDERLVTEVVPLLNADPAIDGVAPILFENVAVVNLDDRLFEISAVLTGLDPQAARAFDALETVDGQLVDLGALALDEVYIDRDGAEEISVEAGDVIGVPVGPGQMEQFTIKAITEAYYVKQVEHRLVLMTSLAHAQVITGKEGLISAVMVSNLGEGDEGIGLTAEIQERLADHPLLRENGLELSPLKQDLIEFANLIGSLFVTIFTLFGLFSICVGILLIFLIFQMLAAERKPEMGMSRAIGMRRSQLVQMFIAEGAMYSIGSAIVGTLVGAGIGALLVIGTSAAFAQASPSGDITLTPTITLRSLLVSFFLGSIVTFITVGFASLRVSRLNIVRAIRDIPEPERVRGGVGRLVWGMILALVGLLLLVSGFNAGQTTPFLLGGALLPMGVAFALRFFGVSQRLLMTVVGLWLIVFYPSAAAPLVHRAAARRLADRLLHLHHQQLCARRGRDHGHHEQHVVRAGGGVMARRPLPWPRAGHQVGGGLPAAKRLPHRPLHHHVRRGRPFSDLGLRDQQQLRRHHRKQAAAGRRLRRGRRCPRRLEPDPGRGTDRGSGPRVGLRRTGYRGARRRRVQNHRRRGG